MSTFAVLLLCIQICLIQNVFSQRCLGAYDPTPGITPAGLSTVAPFSYGAGLAGLGYPATGLAGAYPATGLTGAFPATGCGAGLAPYGGVGEGNVAVAGELPVAGTTAVAGQVPIMGAVSFGGPVAAAGSVSIAGKCACGCGAL